MPPRREIIGRSRAWLLLLAAALMFALGVYLRPVASMNTEPSLTLRVVGGGLYTTGIGALGLAVPITPDHRRKLTIPAEHP